MSGDSRRLPSQSGTRAEVLFASACEEDRTSLRNILRYPNWTLYEAFNCGEALAMLRQSPIPVVICERDLPGGGWKAILDELQAMPARPRLIIWSRLADHQLWGEVLNLGGYDVLPTPFEARVVLRVALLAWHSSRNEAERLAALRRPASPAERTKAGPTFKAAGTGD